MPLQAAPTWSADLTLPSEFVQARRTSKVWPLPLVNFITGQVTNWDHPTSEMHDECGYLQVRINGEDVTWLEAGDGGPATPTQVLTWENAEPFDDAVCVINFPTIWAWDDVPDWLVDGCDVDLIWKQTGEADRTIFEGLFISEESKLSGAATLTIHCIGALYQLDLLVEPPSPVKRTADVGTLIREAVTHSRRYTRVTAPTLVTMGTQTDRSGTFDSVLTGGIQDLLQIANRALGAGGGPVGGPEPGPGPFGPGGDPWTVMKEPGRIMKIRRKRMPISSTPEWTVSAGAPGVEGDLSRDILSAPTSIYGEGTSPDGSRWRNMKMPAYDPAATNPSDVRDRIDRARVLPVYSALVTEPWNYLPDGTIDGTNPFFDPTAVAVERFVAAGERITTAQMAEAASLDILNNWPAKYSGTIVLTDDPEEGHRRWIRAGDNIRVRYFRGATEGQVFHISRVEVDHQSGSVTLTVDQAARDVSAVDALIARVKDANDASKRGLRNQRNSQSVEDRFVPWDKESGSGVLRPVSLGTKTWKIIRIPAAEYGTVVRTEFHLSSPIRFMAGVFGYKPTTTLLTSKGDPFTATTAKAFWDNLTTNPELRQLVAWGGQTVDGEPDFAGFFPGLERQGATPTGWFLDEASWVFESKDSPWLWLAVIAESACTFWGGDSPDYFGFRVGID